MAREFYGEKSRSSRRFALKFKKNYQGRTRDGDLTRQFKDGSLDDQNIQNRERVSGKGI
ncbi:MAG: hypothetical protein U0930_21565 [Pirellulales bacterium]